MKAIVYFRVSTDRQGRSGLGLEAQRASVDAYLRTVDAEVVGEFTEVECGEHADRPDLAKALALCKRENATLVVAKLDRLYRNLHAITTLMVSGVEFVAADNPHANKLTIHILAAVAEEERDMIRRRTREALKAAKARGVKLGSPTPERGAALGREVLTQRAQAYARRTLALVPRGSLRQMAAELTARGITTPRGSTAWHPSQVANLLRNAP